MCPGSRRPVAPFRRMTLDPLKTKPWPFYGLRGGPLDFEGVPKSTMFAKNLPKNYKKGCPERRLERTWFGEGFSMSKWKALRNKNKHFALCLKSFAGSWNLMKMKSKRSCKIIENRSRGSQRTVCSWFCEAFGGNDFGVRFSEARIRPEINKKIQCGCPLRKKGAQGKHTQLLFYRFARSIRANGSFRTKIQLPWYKN